MRLAIVGYTGETHIGASLHRAALKAGIPVHFFDAAEATGGPALLRSLAWRIWRRPLGLGAFSSRLAQHYRRESAPDILLTTGTAPLEERALRQLRSQGTVCLNYSTDDPWSPVHRSRWHLRALPAYDLVFTPRRANIPDFEALGCRVQYLPFGYDADLFSREAVTAAEPAHDVLFVGGADPHRVTFVEEFMRNGPAPALVGGYWERYKSTRALALGHRTAREVAGLTRAARINLCLVRRLNRDGHVMRSLEAAALGACMLVEDTNEHRELFGPDAESVCYFRSAAEAGGHANRLLGDPREMARLADSVYRKVTSGAHTYGDRLAAMISSARTLRGT